MIMTREEKTELLANMEEIQKLNKQKTNLALDTIMFAKQLIAENISLIQENIMLKRQLEIAEKEILRMRELQS